MTAPARSLRLRWIAPVAVAGLVAAGVAAPQLADAAESPEDLAPRTAAELLQAVSTARVDGLSGTVVSTTRLGLPELPSTGAGGGSAVTLTGLLSGSTTARVWLAGEDRSRIAVDAPFAEYDVVRDGRTVWTYDSASSDVTRLQLPERSGEPAPAPVEPGAATPQQAAEAVLAAIDPTTTVSVGTAATVGGRAAYELVLDPRDPGTLVDSVRIAVDGETSVPLRVQVRGVGQAEPAVEVGFTAVRFAEPDDSVFDFVPPAGAEVTERILPELGEKGEKDAQARPEQPAGSAPQVLGEGWTRVVELTGVTVPEGAAGMLAQLSTPVEGGRVVTSALLSVLLLDDGRVLAGAVPAERLVELARR